MNRLQIAFLDKCTITTNRLTFHVPYGIFDESLEIRKELEAMGYNFRESQANSKEDTRIS